MKSVSLLVIVIKACMVISLVLMATACDVHEFPGDETRILSKAVEVEFDLTFDSNIPLYKEVDVTSRAQSNYVHYIVEAYYDYGNGTYSQIPDQVASYTKADLTDLDQTIKINLVPGDYRIIAWADYVEDENPENSQYFDTSNLCSVSINENKATSGNTDMADAFSAVSYITVTGSRASTYEVAMTRPVAKFEIITTDVDVFADMIMSKSRADVRKDIERGNYKILVTYSGFTPSTYNVVGDYTSDSRLDLSFTGTITLLNDDEALLGFDYVFINADGGNITVNVTVFDSDGIKLASSGQITVPLMQGELTVIKGNFLSADLDNGGVGIDPGFEGPDTNIRV